MSVFLVTEDELSEAVGLKLLREHQALVQIPPTALRQGGFGYLRSRMDSWKQLAQQQTVVLLTDLDRTTCPVRLLEEWLGSPMKCPEKLIFRIAEKEIESWLLADHEAITTLLGNKIKLPREPDTLPDPKQYLLEQAKKAPRRTREDLVAETGSTAKQGLGYNARLVSWVADDWSPQRAANRSPSLCRARNALNKVARSLQPAQ